MPAVFFLWWPTARIVMVAALTRQRAQIHVLRGAEVLGRKEFDTFLDAAEFQYACRCALWSVCRPAFATNRDAVGLLGNDGAGRAGCFHIPGDLMGREMPEFCDMALNDLDWKGF